MVTFNNMLQVLGWSLEQLSTYCDSQLWEWKEARSVPEIALIWLALVVKSDHVTQTAETKPVLIYFPCLSNSFYADSILYDVY